MADGFFGMKKGKYPKKLLSKMVKPSQNRNLTNNILSKHPEKDIDTGVIRILQILALIEPVNLIQNYTYIVRVCEMNKTVPHGITDSTFKLLCLFVKTQYKLIHIPPDFQYTFN